MLYEALIYSRMHYSKDRRCRDTAAPRTSELTYLSGSPAATRTSIFITHVGQFEYLVIPYALANSSSIYRAFMNKVLSGLLNKFVVVYIDNILIYSSSLEQRAFHVHTVLQWLPDYHLYVKGEKCEFLNLTSKFLGYVIQPGSVAIDKDKVKDVREWPLPGMVKELQQFLGFSYFYCLIRNFCQVTRGKGTRLQQAQDATAVFQKLQNAFCSASAILKPHPKLPFELQVDASEVLVGAVLLQ